MTKDQIQKAHVGLRAVGLNPKDWVLMGRFRRVSSTRYSRKLNDYNYSFKHRVSGKNIFIPGGWGV